MSSTEADHCLGRGNLPQPAPELAGLAVEWLCWHLPLLHRCLQGGWGTELHLPYAQRLDWASPEQVSTGSSLTRVSLLQKDTSGDYRKALLALCGGED